MELKYLETKLARATVLPLLSNVVAQVLTLSQNPNASARDYERVLIQDAALTAKILRTANSPVFSGGGHITTLGPALTQIGSNTLRSICLTVSLQSALTAKSLNKSFHPSNFWLHSLGVACGAKLIARLLRDSHAEEAFIAGLMHDIGKLALCLFLAQEADTVYKMMQGQSLSQFDAEMQILQVTHQEIGLMAAQCWQLPEIYLSPISRHHNPVEFGMDIDRLTAYVHVANVIAHEVGLGFETTLVTPSFDPDVLAMLNISEAQYDNIRVTVVNEVDKLSSQIGL